MEENDQKEAEVVPLHRKDPIVEHKEVSPIIVSAEDRSRAEVTQLKLMLALKDETIAQTNLAIAARNRSEAMVVSEQVREELEKKYNVDLKTHFIRESDGMIIPSSKRASLLEQLQRVR